MGGAGRADLNRLLAVQAVLDLVHADVLALTGQHSHVLVQDDEEWGPRLVGDGDSAADLTLSGAALAVEVARAAQDSLVEQVWAAGPLCSTHDRALHPGTADGLLVWECGEGHVVAEVGRLRRDLATW